MILFNQLECVAKQPTYVEFSTDHEDIFLRIEACASNVFRIICGSKKAFEKRNSTARAQTRQNLLVALSECFGELELSETDQAWLLKYADSYLEVSKKQLAFKFYKDENCLLQSAHEFQEVLVQDDDGWAFMLALQEQEKIYGLGLTQGDFNRRGEEIVSDNPAYKSLPLAWSNLGWGLYVNSLNRVIHSVGTDDAPQSYQIRSADALFDFFVFLDKPEEVFNLYTQVTGRTGQPDLSSMGLWFKQLVKQPEQDFIDLAEDLREKGYPLDTLNFAMPSLIQFDKERMNLEWDTQRLGDNPRLFFEKHQENQWSFAIPTFPGVLVGTELFDDLDDRGWLLGDENGYAYQFKGNAASNNQAYGLLDLSYKDALKFWQERHQQLIEHNQALVVQFDNIEMPDEINGRHGEEGATIRTLYPMLVQQGLFDAITAQKTPAEAVVLRDFVCPSGHRFPWLQAAPYEASWEGFQQLYRELLSTQASGMPFVMHDIGNPDLTAPLDEKLYLRLLAFSVFSCNFAFYADEKLLPLQYSKKAQTLVKKWLGLRYRLIPFILGIIDDSARTGLPVQRMMPLCFPDDLQAHEYTEQFLLGPGLLVAPILDDGDIKTVYLPKGETWWDLNSGKSYEGGQVLNYKAGVETIPIFGRDGHMLCVGPSLSHLGDLNTARLLDEIWMFGMPAHNPVVMRNKIRVMQMRGSSYIKGLEGLKILQSEGLEVKRRGAEVRISFIR